MTLSYTASCRLKMRMSEKSADHGLHSVAAYRVRKALLAAKQHRSYFAPARVFEAHVTLAGFECFVP